MKRTVVFVRNAHFDEVSSHFVTLHSYARGFASAGFACEFRELNTVVLEDELDADLARDEVVAFFCMNGFGMKPHTEGGKNIGEKLAASGKLLLCHIGNQPFYAYMIDYVLADHAFKVSFYKDASMRALALRLLGEPSGAHCVMPAIMHRFEESPEHAAVPPSRRSIPFVYAGTFYDPAFIRGRFLAAFPHLLKPFEELVDAALFEHSIAIWSVLENIVAAQGRQVDWRDHDTLAILDAADGYVRWKRRELLLQRLARHPGLFIGDRPPSVDLHRRATLMGRMPQKEVLKAFYQARSCVMVQPNHPFSHSERMLNAMSRGCIAITDENEAIRSDFVEGVHYLGLDADYENLDEQLARLDDDSLTQRMSQAGRETVSQVHDPEIVVAGMLEACAAAGRPIDPDD